MPEKSAKKVSGDPLLTRLLDEADAGFDFDFGITLDVQGSIVSGVLVGEAEWLDGWHGLGGGQWRDDIVEDVRGGTDGQPRFIHLKNARYWHGAGPIPADKGLLWRGRADQLSGWAEGTLSE